MIANTQEQSCTLLTLSSFANAVRMAQEDKALIEHLVEYTGLSASKLAVEAGLTPSTLTRPLHQPVKHRLSTPTLAKLHAAYPEFPHWPGRLFPPPNASVMRFEGESLEQAEESLPVWGSALGAARLFEGEAIEQTTLNSGEVMEYVKRPSLLRDKAYAYALHVQGSSMEPALDDGDMIVAVRDWPLSSGDLVVVHVRDGEDDGARARGVLVKRLVRRSASWVELRQYEPDMQFRVPMSEVLRIDKVLTRREMLL